MRLVSQQLPDVGTASTSGRCAAAQLLRSCSRWGRRQKYYVPFRTERVAAAAVTASDQLMAENTQSAPVATPRMSGPGYVYNTADAPSSRSAATVVGPEGEHLHVCVGMLVVGDYTEIPHLGTSFMHILDVGPGDVYSGKGPGGAARALPPRHVHHRHLPVNLDVSHEEIFLQLDRCVEYIRRARAAHWATHARNECVFVCSAPGSSHATAVALAHQLEHTDARLEDLLDSQDFRRLIATTTDGLFPTLLELLHAWDRWRRQTDLLQETLQVMADHGKRPADVRYVVLQPLPPAPASVGSLGTSLARPRSRSGGAWCSFAKFAQVAGQVRYANYDINKISVNLQICGDDWWMTRGEYSGIEEWWEFHTRPGRPTEQRDCTVSDVLVDGWTLETAAEPELRWRAWMQKACQGTDAPPAVLEGVMVGSGVVRGNSASSAEAASSQARGGSTAAVADGHCTSTRS